MLLDWVAQEAVGLLSPMPDVIYYLLYKQCTHFEILRSPTAMQVQATGWRDESSYPPLLPPHVSPTHFAMPSWESCAGAPLHAGKRHMLCKTTCYNAHVITYN